MAHAEIRGRGRGRGRGRAHAEEHWTTDQRPLTALTKPQDQYRYLSASPTLTTLTGSASLSEPCYSPLPRYTPVQAFPDPSDYSSFMGGFSSVTGAA